MLKLFTLLIILRSSVNVLSSERPILGVLLQELSPPMQHLFPHDSFYVAASYVKAIEGSGARVVPIFANKSEQYYRDLLQSINGVVLPGGEALLIDGQPYYEASKMIFNIVLEMNSKGDYFPLLGICLGFETVVQLANNGTDIRRRCNVTENNYPVNFRPHYRESQLFSKTPFDILISLQYLNITVNRHVMCVTPRNFTKNGLEENWLVTTDNVNDEGIKFISSMEHRRYPIVGLQFHPEKCMYEWSSAKVVPHTLIAIRANRFFYDFIVHKARSNNHTYASKQLEESSLMYGYSPIYTGNSTSFTQIYFF